MNNSVSRKRRFESTTNHISSGGMNTQMRNGAMMGNSGSTVTYGNVEPQSNYGNYYGGSFTTSGTADHYSSAPVQTGLVKRAKREPPIGTRFTSTANRLPNTLGTNVGSGFTSSSPGVNVPSSCPLNTTRKMSGSSSFGCRSGNRRIGNTSSGPFDYTGSDCPTPSSTYRTANRSTFTTPSANNNTPPAQDLNAYRYGTGSYRCLEGCCHNDDFYQDACDWSDGDGFDDYNYYDDCYHDRVGNGRLQCGNPYSSSGQWSTGSSGGFGNNSITATVNNGVITVNNITLPIAGGTITCMTFGNGNVSVYSNGAFQVLRPTYVNGYNNTDIIGNASTYGNVPDQHMYYARQPQKRRETVTRPTSVENDRPVHYDGDECIICFEQYTRLRDKRFLPCGHHFHRTCFEKWQNVDNTCPICRMDVF